MLKLKEIDYFIHIPITPWGFFPITKECAHELAKRPVDEDNKVLPLTMVD